MIYLIITTSLVNRYDALGAAVGAAEDRAQEYVRAIQDTMQQIDPSLGVRWILVENNRQEGFFESRLAANPWVEILYTDNNATVYRNKGVTELMDLHEVIRRSSYHIQDTDVIIKLTGRYRMITDAFVRHVIQTESMYDAWMKFYHVDREVYDDTDCVLGCFAIRVLYLRLYSPRRLEVYDVPEKAWARYVRFTIPRVDFIRDLGVECHFARNGHRLRV